MGYATTYATPEIIEATWTAASPSTTGAIEIRPYPTASPQGGGGFAMPAPPPNPLDGFDDYGGKRYLDASGNPQWMPTPDEIARDRRAGLPVRGIDYDRLDGMDGSYTGRPPRTVAPSSVGSIGRAAGSNMDDVIGQLGGRVALGAGGVVAGGIAGLGEYNDGGGVASAIGVGVGAGVGSVAGAVAGGMVGAIGGPVGVAIGGAVGSAIGGAIGGLIGDAIIPDANQNGAQQPGPPPFTGGQCAGIAYEVTWVASSAWGRNDIGYVNGPVAGVYYIPASPWAKFAIVYNAQGATSASRTLDISAPEDGYIVSCRRLDNQIDNCGDPAPTLQPYDPNTRTRTRPMTPAIGLPGVDLPDLGPIGNPGPGLRRPNLPFGEPNPTGDPTEGPDGYPYPTPDPDPTPTPGPTGDPAPYPTPDPDPTPGPNPDPDPETCDPCAKLDQVLDLLQPSVTGEIDLSPCPVGDNPAQDIRSMEGTGLAGISQKIDLALAGVEELWELLRCQDESPMLLTPEWWPYRAGSERPQLLVVYAMKNDDGTWSRIRFQFNIPWFDNRKRRALKSILPKRIQKGRHQGTLTLSDNSKMIQFCRSQAESERVLKAFEQLVIPRYKTGDIRFADTNGNAKREFREITVELMEARYYAQGQRQESPSWRDKFY